MSMCNMYIYNMNVENALQCLYIKYFFNFILITCWVLPAWQNLYLYMKQVWSAPIGNTFKRTKELHNSQLESNEYHLHILKQNSIYVWFGYLAKICTNIMFYFNLYTISRACLFLLLLFWYFFFIFYRFFFIQQHLRYSAHL